MIARNLNSSGKDQPTRRKHWAYASWGEGAVRAGAGSRAWGQGTGGEPPGGSGEAKGRCNPCKSRMPPSWRAELRSATSRAPQAWVSCVRGISAHSYERELMRPNGAKLKLSCWLPPNQDGKGTEHSRVGHVESLSLLVGEAFVTSPQAFFRFLASPLRRP